MKSNDENNDDDDTTTSSEQQQQQHHDGNELGDPSGQSTATYWDQWFKTICYNNNNNSNNNTNNNNNNSHCSSNSNDDNDNKNKNNKLSFEWYTTPSEIERLLKNHLFPRLISKNNNNNNNKEDKDKDKDKDKPTTTTSSSTSALPFRLIHPGSGNSLVPLHLHLHYPYSHHDIIDVSSVALTEIEKYHSFLLSKNNSTTTTTTSNNSPPPPRMMSYHVGDVLTTSLPYDDNIFDGWIDKGLFDALFSSSSSSKETTIENCHLLFNEAHRVLNPGGVCIVVSLGQDHSLELLVNEVWGYQMRGKKLWELEVEIYELDPVMTEGGAAGGGVAVSSLRPFGFVFRKRHEERLQSMDNKNLIKDDDDDDDEIMKLSFHHRGENIMTPIIPNDDDDDDDDENDCHALLAPLRRILSHSRDEFAKTVRKQQQQQSKQASQNNTRFLSATFHVKPQDETTNLESLRQTITTTSNTTAAAAEHNVTSLRWRESRIVPLAFGLQMLVLTVIVSADDVEDVALWMEEEFEEMGVKSVDVDWGETVPVSMDVGDVLRLVTTTTT